MRCPNCYGKVDKESNICTKCFFDLNKLKNASNKKAIELKRQGDGDLCINSKVLPKDVSKKKLALFCGFLGLFGAHYFYVGKMFRGLMNLVFSLFGLIFAMMPNKLPYVLQAFELIFMVGFVFVIANTIFDFINILLNKFSVPVYIEEENKKENDKKNKKV